MLSSRNVLMLIGLGAALATVLLLAGLTGATKSRDNAFLMVDAIPLAPATTTSVPPSSPTTPSTTNSSTPTSSSPTGASSTATTSSASPAVPGTDAQGFVGTVARCPEGQSVVAAGRTQRSLVVICATGNGNYQYHGVRISDDVSLTADAELLGSGTYVAHSDGATYSVSPEIFAVTHGSKLLYRDTWISYDAPGYSAEHGSTTAVPSTTSGAATSTTTTSTTTTSTTATSTAPR